MSLFHAMHKNDCYRPGCQTIHITGHTRRYALFFPGAKKSIPCLTRIIERCIFPAGTYALREDIFFFFALVYQSAVTFFFVFNYLQHAAMALLHEPALQDKKKAAHSYRPNRKN